MPLGGDETAEWCNSIVLVPKANGKVWLCLDPVQLNQALIRLVHRGPTLKDILPKLNNIQYLSIIDASLGYHNLKLDKKSSYLTTFACPFGRYRYKQLPFGAVLAGDMFQCKIDKMFNDMLNVFGIADDILVIGCNKDGADHDEAVYKVLKWCQDVNLKLKKENVISGVHQYHSLGRLYKTGHPTQSTKGESTDGNAGTQKQKGTAGLPGCN